MELRNHPAFTRIFGKPQDWNEAENGPCGALSVCDIVSDGKKFMESLWTPTDEERAAIANGAPVVLWVSGTAHPVVALCVADPEALAKVEALKAVENMKKPVDG